MAPTKRDDDTEQFRTDIRDLYKKINGASEGIVNIDARLKSTLPFLATKLDIEQSVNSAITNHIQSYHNRKTPKSMLPVPKTSGNKSDTKIIVAIIGIATILATTLQKALDAILSMIPQ